MTEWLDHVIWACNDLERGVARFEALTGVAPRYGGVHASGHTHNALVALSERCYLEILAPTGSPAADEDEWCRFARAADEPTLLTYCLRSPQPLSALAVAAESLGAAATRVGANGRSTPEGVRLHWQWVGPKFAAFGRAFPFFIDWLDSPHPAGSAQIRLTRFAVGHPNAARLEQILRELQTPVEIYAAPEIQFQALLDTPRGAVAL
jgi:hypothetical protein